MEYLNGTGKVLFRRREKGLGVAGSDGMARQSPSILKLMPMDALASLRTLPAETWFDVYRHGRGARRFYFPRMEWGRSVGFANRFESNTPLRPDGQCAANHDLRPGRRYDEALQGAVPAALTRSVSPAPMKRRLACSR